MPELDVEPQPHTVRAVPAPTAQARPGVPWRAVAAEALGTGVLLCCVVGSGIAATRFSPDDVGLQMMQNVGPIVLVLAVLIVTLGPVCGAHFNPLVTVVEWWLHRGDDPAVTVPRAVAYVVAQMAGGAAGTVVADVMFGLAPVLPADQDRLTAAQLLGEVVATAGLIAVIFMLRGTGQGRLGAPVVAAYVGSACWFTSSTCFANPAVTWGRTLSDTFTGIAPVSAAAFCAAQCVGAVLGGVVVLVLLPRRPARAGA